MVIPRSRSRSIASSTWACISRAVREPVSSSNRSESVDLPWSMWAMIAKLRMCLLSMKGCRWRGRTQLMYERKVAPPILSFTLRAPGNTIKGKKLVSAGDEQTYRGLYRGLYPGLCRKGGNDAKSAREGSNTGGLNIARKVFMLVVAAAPLLFTGCVPETGVTKGPAKSPQATAPALKPSETAPVQASAPAAPAA